MEHSYGMNLVVLDISKFGREHPNLDERTAR